MTHYNAYILKWSSTREIENNQHIKHFYTNHHSTSNSEFRKVLTFTGQIFRSRNSTSMMKRPWKVESTGQTKSSQFRSSLSWTTPWCKIALFIHKNISLYWSLKWHSWISIISIGLGGTSVWTEVNSLCQIGQKFFIFPTVIWARHKELQSDLIPL